MAKERNIAFDILKGITIILMIVGHLDVFTKVNASWFSVVRTGIYAFHMPLFFVVAGYFFNGNKGGVRKDIKRLLLPYAFTVGVCAIIYAVYSVATRDAMNEGEPINSLVIRAFWGSGWHHGGPIWGRVPAFAPIWFLGALFWCKQAFGVFHKLISQIEASRTKYLVILGISCLSASILFTFIDQRIAYLPLSFNQGLSAIIFFYFGYLARNIRITRAMKIRLIIIALINIPVCRIGLACCHYQLYPINILGATAITWILYMGCKAIQGNNILSRFLSWCGRNSLLILCVHSVMVVFKDLTIYQLQPEAVLLEIVAGGIILSWLASKAKIVRTVFN